MIFDFNDLYKDLNSNDFGEWAESLPEQIEQTLVARQHGKTVEWQKILSELPEISTSKCDFNTDKLLIGDSADCTSIQKEDLETSLQQLHPWRKGPYQLFDIHIDTEWHSDWKWQRIQPHISPLKNRSVLRLCIKLSV